MSSSSDLSIIKDEHGNPIPQAAPSPCCKCAAYQGLLALQAVQMTRMKGHMDEALKLFQYANNEVRRASEVKL